MGIIEYKVDYFGCTFSTRRKFNRQLQEIIDRYAGDGWKLHSFKVLDLSTFCTVVFYRETN